MLNAAVPVTEKLELQDVHKLSLKGSLFNCLQQNLGSLVYIFRCFCAEEIKKLPSQTNEQTQKGDIIILYMW